MAIARNFQGFFSSEVYSFSVATYQAVVAFPMLYIISYPTLYLSLMTKCVLFARRATL